ncbi:STAS domain-containing protein [Vibrio metschnikovii]|nr:STAS domain-containing protein [Vibrio metschnikovii]
MQILEENDQHVNIELSGELTIYQAQEMYEFLTPWVMKPIDLLIDVTRITDLDTSAIQLLVMVNKAKREQQQQCLLLVENPLFIQVMAKLGVNALNRNLALQPNT